MATVYARPLSQVGFTKEPILRLSDVNKTSATTANESWRLKMT